MFASRVGGSSRPGPSVRSGFTGEGEARRHLKAAVGVAATTGSSPPFILQVARAPATAEEEQALASKPPPLSPGVFGPRAASLSETEAAALQQAEEQRRSAGGRTAGPCPPVTEHKPTQERRTQPRSRDVETQTGQTSLRER